MIKHPTASVFVFGQRDGEWRLGLIRHPRLGRWMIPGGHVEPHENPAEAALREVAEETGHRVRLVPPSPRSPCVSVSLDSVIVASPFLIVEERVPPDREPHEHVHVDHLYVAFAPAGDLVGTGELPVRWHRADELAGLHMFDDTRTLAGLLFTELGQFLDVRDGLRDGGQEGGSG
jgi:8-oxo-dGTP pyrophosphatase MutT (NUDIX family)